MRRAAHPRNLRHLHRTSSLRHRREALFGGALTAYGQLFGSILELEAFRVGVRATDSRYLLLGTDANDLIEYARCSPDVARAWRQATIEFLEKQAERIGRRLPSPDWASLAFEADPAWARANG